MGFNLVDDGFYSSGHPALGSTLENPLGILKSMDYGKTLALLDLQGVEDFHWMTVGYKTHAIYVYNTKPNSIMKTAGLYVTVDDTRTWKRCQASGIKGEMTSIAAHPTDPGTVVISTREGVYTSNNYGDQFDKLPLEQKVTAVAYGVNGDLFVGGKQLFRQSGEESKLLIIPALDLNDSVMYISQNSQNENEIALATFDNDVYISRDLGISWIQIVNTRKGINTAT